ncbi:FIG138056: a glutathione-dependent thiol reductase [Pseudoalteromonas luteoviolacea B = ATCC 29581]|nr:FIG138056: a glutathione-dependent thiol reductase [Pseudoalteromonas luteoviolacea B = ATCC 29581]
MNTIMYGISNCDTIKKAKKQLETQGISYTFHDYRKDGITKDLVDSFLNTLSWESLLNKRGTTYRQLNDEQKANLNPEKAIALMLEFPALIKRPVLHHRDTYILGFNKAVYEGLK